MDMQGALQGIKVIDMSRLLPGPWCSMVMADHGARVIALEDKRYAAEGLLETVYRNKEHVTLNLASPEGKKIFFQLAETADVVLEGFRPGVMGKLGVGYEDVKKINPGIIYCSITGYGQNGPYRDRVGHDVNYLSISGILNLIGAADRPPSIPGIQIADIAGGGMNAMIGILLALQARHQTGKGQYIDISMTDGMLGLLPAALMFRQFLGKDPQRSDTMLSHRYACYNTYETADGRFLSIGAVEPRFWKILCELLEVPEYIPVQYDDGKREEIIDFMKKTFRSKTLDEWDEILGDLDICWGRIQNLTEVLEDPLFLERETIVEVEKEDGQRFRTFGIPVKLSETPGSVRTPPIGFGQSTRAVLAELGYGEAEIDDFFEKGVV